MSGVATMLIALAMRATAYGNATVWAGVLTGVVDVVGPYPWFIGSRLNFVCETVFAAWFIATGIKLAKFGFKPSEPT